MESLDGQSSEHEDYEAYLMKSVVDKGASTYILYTIMGLVTLHQTFFLLKAFCLYGKIKKEKRNL